MFFPLVSLDKTCLQRGQERGDLRGGVPAPWLLGRLPGSRGCSRAHPRLDADAEGASAVGREHSQAFSHAWPPGQDLVGAQALHLGVAKGTEGTRSWVLSQYSGKSAPLPSVPEPLPGASAWSSVDQVGGLLDPTMKEKAIRAPEPGCLHSFTHSLIHSANAC